MRNTFITKLIELAENDESIVLIVGDLGFNVIEPFQERFPDRFINAGICEQNMASLAAGMANQGCKVFVYSIANFPTFRCAEQIRNDICYHNLPVTIVTVGGGLSYGNLGYSHHAVQDYGLIRLFPEIIIASPGDPNEVKGCLDYIVKENKPSYLRLRKAGETTYSNHNDLIAGNWNKVVESKNKKIFLTTGYGLELAMRLRTQNKYKDYGIYTCPVWGARLRKKQEEQFKCFENVISVEDHLVDCGFGSWLRESISSTQNQKLTVKALNQGIIGKVGNEEYLLEVGGLLD